MSDWLRQSRMVLHNQLVDILDKYGELEDDAILHVYFQPPETIKLKYPCIIYNLSRIEKNYADDQAYSKKPRYDVLLITKDPDTPLIDPILDIRYCAFDRFYTANNLNHYSFTINRR